MKGHDLQALRKSFGLTQVQFAERLGIHPLTLSRFERESDPISQLVQLAICELTRRLEEKSRKPTKKPQKKKVSK